MKTTKQLGLESILSALGNAGFAASAVGTDEGEFDIADRGGIIAAGRVLLDGSIGISRTTLRPTKRSDLAIRIARDAAVAAVRDATILWIATKFFDRETLEETKSDRADFVDANVATLRKALEAAFEAGRASR